MDFETYRREATARARVLERVGPLTLEEIKLHSDEIAAAHAPRCGVPRDRLQARLEAFAREPAEPDAPRWILIAALLGLFS